MPGSPPTSTADPGTNPPPATRSNSVMPVWMRGGLAISPFNPTSRDGRPLGKALPFAPEAGASVASSIMEFQEPQSSQRPDHLLWAVPQD